MLEFITEFIYVIVLLWFNFVLDMLDGFIYLLGFVMKECIESIMDAIILYLHILII